MIKLFAVCRAAGMRVAAINVKSDLETQEPYVIVLHNLTDLLARWRDGDDRVGGMINKLKRYLGLSPQTMVLDPLSAVRRLSNRFKTYIMIRKQLAFEDVQVLPFVLIRADYDHRRRIHRVRQKGLVYPLLAKPKIAQNHEIMIVFNEHGLNDFGSMHYPVVLQTFVPHGGVLFKVYAIGKHHQIIVRPSVRDLESSPTRPNLAFATADVSRSTSRCDLHPPGGPPKSLEHQLRRPDPVKVQKLIDRIARVYNLTLIGIDLILENNSGRHYVIDVNYFPGYDGMDDTAEVMFKHISGLVNQAAMLNNHSQAPSTASEPTESEPEVIVSD